MGGGWQGEAMTGGESEEWRGKMRGAGEGEGGERRGEERRGEGRGGDGGGG